MQPTGLRGLLRRSRNSSVFLALIVLAGAALRVREALDPLWFDEVWVASSLYSGSLRDALHYTRVPQSTPPLWIALNYSFVQAFTPGDFVLRLFPLLSGIALIIASAGYAGHVLGSSYRLAGAAVAAASGFLIAYSGQLKQYESDALLATLLLWGLVACLQRGGARRWCVLAALYGVSIFLAYTQLLMMPLVALAMGWEAWRKRLSVALAVGLSAGVAAAGIVALLLFIKPNTSSLLKAFWTDQFPQSWAGAAPFYWLKAQQWTKVLYRGGKFEEVFGLVMLALIVAGVVALVARRRVRLGGAWAVAGFAVSFSVLAVASALKQYPMGPARLLLFSFPVLLTVWLGGVGAVAGAAGRVLGKAAAGTLIRAWPVLLAGLLMALMARDLARPPRGRPELPDTPGMVRALRDQAREGDTVWVHGSAVDLMEYYFMKQGKPAGRIIRSSYGLPCCVTEREAVKGVSYAGEIQKELDAAGRNGLGRVWLATLEGVLIPNGVDDTARLLESLERRGCRVEGTQQFRGGRVDLVDCGGAVNGR